MVVVAAAIAPFLLYAALSAEREKGIAGSTLSGQSLERARATAQSMDARLLVVDQLLDSAMVQVRRPGKAARAVTNIDAEPSPLSSTLTIAVLDTSGQRTSLLMGGEERVDRLPAIRRTSLVASAISIARQKRSDNTSSSTFVDEGNTREDGDSIAMIIVRPITRSSTRCDCLADTPGALVAVLSDRAIQSLLGSDTLPDGGIAVLMGGGGGLLGRPRVPERWIESEIGDSTLLATSAVREGVVELKGKDQVARAFGFATLKRLPWRVYVGVPKSSLAAVPEQRFRDVLMLSVLALAIAVVGVVLASRAFSAPLQLLVADTKRLAAGALSHRTSVSQRGGELGVLGTAMNALAADMEKRRKSLQDEVRRLSQVFESSPIPTWIADASHEGIGSGRIQQANVAASRLFGIPVGALIGQRDSELLDEAGAELLEPRESDLDEVFPIVRNTRAMIRTLSGETHKCLVTVAFSTNARDALRIVTVFLLPEEAVDVTTPVEAPPRWHFDPEPVPAQETRHGPLNGEAPPALPELPVEQETTVATNGAAPNALPPANSNTTPTESPDLSPVIAFAAHIADDYADVMQGLDGFTQLAIDSHDDPDMRAIAIERIRELAARGLALTRQVQSFARRDALQLSVIDANETLTEAVQAMAGTLGRDVELDVLYNVSPAQVVADPFLLNQIVIALISNARDAMPAGGTLTLATTFVEIPEEEPDVPYAAPPGQYIVLTIADTGTGMSTEAQRQMFEPFWSTKRAEGRGVGLALAAAHGIAVQHGWVIGVDSEAEVGTAVSVYMPVAGEIASDVHSGADDQSTLETIPARSE